MDGGQEWHQIGHRWLQVGRDKFENEMRRGQRRIFFAGYFVSLPRDSVYFGDTKKSKSIPRWDSIWKKRLDLLSYAIVLPKFRRGAFFLDIGIVGAKTCQSWLRKAIK